MRSHWREVVTDVLSKHLQPAFIIVFGSFAKGNPRAESDLDLAYYSNKSLNKYDRFLLAGKMAGKCDVEIDLVDIREVDTVFAAQIFSTGEVLACAEETTLVKERMKALSIHEQWSNEDIVLNKVAIIERCVKRVREVYAGNPDHLRDFTKQDSIILNIQRACEASIDLAMHIVSTKKLGLPKKSQDAFQFLNEAGIMDDQLTKSLMNMVGFRNIAVHDYQTLDLNILHAIIEKHLNDFIAFTKVVLKVD